MQTVTLTFEELHMLLRLANRAEKVRRSMEAEGVPDTGKLLVSGIYGEGDSAVEVRIVK